MVAALAAAVVALSLAITGTFIARAKLVEAQAWVRHTSEVELSISECRLRLRDRPNGGEVLAAALSSAREAAERIQVLTVDNPQQQQRVAVLLDRLRAGAARAGVAPDADATLRDLMAAEGSLMDARIAALARATRIGWLLLAVSAVLTVAMVAVFVRLVHRQAVSLTGAEATLREKTAMLESLVDSMVDGIMAVRPDRGVLLYNHAARRLLGERFPRDRFPDDWQSLLACVYEDGTKMGPRDGALARALNGQTTDNLLYNVRRIDGPDAAGTWISATGRPVVGADGKVIAALAILRDVSEQKRLQDELRALSISDELTGLYNRRGFLILAEQHARLAERQQLPFAIVFMDLNGLKVVNDTLGHEAGDRMIRAAAGIMRAVVRESDLLARLGGDEFVTLLANTRPEIMETVLDRVRDGLAKHNLTTDGPPLSLSVGVSFFDPRQPVPIPDLLVDADREMYKNKRAGRQQRQ